MDNRFCTLHAIFHPGNQTLTQPEPVIVFRGKGVRISEVEKHPRVKVFFQEKAWVDRNVSNAIAATHFGPFVAQHNKGEETLLFCDNLDAQVTPQFLQILCQVN